MSTITFTPEEVKIMAEAIERYEREFSEKAAPFLALAAVAKEYGVAPNEYGSITGKIESVKRLLVELRAKLYVLQDAGGCASLFDKVVVTNDSA